MAPSISRAPTPARHLEQLAALRALAAELSGDRREYQRQTLEPHLLARLQLDADGATAIPLLLIDLGSGGTRALAPAGMPLQAGMTGTLVTGEGGRREGQRQVRVRWVKPQARAELLGLSFENRGRQAHAEHT